MKDCPVKGCATRIETNLVMCRFHWAKVPPALKNTVWTTYDRGRGVGTRGHLAAVKVAIDAVNSQLVKGDKK